MNKVRRTAAALLLVPMLLSVSVITRAQRPRRTSPASRTASAVEPRLTGVYRLDVESSDKLYSVVAGASSNLPFGEQQRFFIDLTIRLTPPDQIAIEQRGRIINIASSRAPRITFEADGVARAERASDGHVVRTRAALDNDRLTVNVTGSSDDRFTVTFDSIDNGRRLRVTRRIYAQELNQPVVIQSIYNKISEVANWGIYDELPASPANPPTVAAATADSPSRKAERAEAIILRAALDEWIAATNARDIRKQMAFYMSTVQAFYLTRNVPREAVRAEKARVFARASMIDVRADEPEIIFLDNGRMAIMRFRKKYAIEGAPRNRRGEVIQELRWQQTSNGWKIISERDVRVIR